MVVKTMSMHIFNFTFKKNNNDNNTSVHFGK